jgi:hypothetical protein
MNKLGLGAKLGSKQKAQTLRELSPTGELAAPGGGGLFGGGLGGLFGGGSKAPGELGPMGPGPGRGAGAGLPGMGAPGGGLGGLGGMFGGPRPMGSSATRKSGSKRKEKQRRKKGKGR